MLEYTSSGIIEHWFPFKTHFELAS